MYPNPQEALPLPPRPDVEQYRKQAKDLVKACKSGDPQALRRWALDWIETLSGLQEESVRPRKKEDVARDADEIVEFARTKLLPDADRDRRCRLSEAQFVIARAHGFTSWPKLVSHLESLARSNSPVSAFESAADAIVRGDAATLERLLRQNPGLVRTRSTREHKATLLHYVSANGVEGYRQKSPENAARIAEMLLQAGADVDARAEVYGGGCTTLGLVATSAPPAIAGVQRDVIDVLLKHGARMDAAGSAGHDHTLVRACLANGQPEAAAYLADGGAPLDLPGAAGIGRVDVVARFFNDEGGLTSDATVAQLVDAFALASAYGQANVVTFLLDHGVDVDMQLRGHGEGHTALHVAAYHAHVDVVQLLLRRGARVDVIDKTWGTPPLIWALTGWRERKRGREERYYNVVAQLVAAGAIVTPKLLDWDEARADPRMLAALSARTS